MRRRFPDEASTARQRGQPTLFLTKLDSLLLIGRLASAETYPYPKSQNSPLESVIAASDISTHTITWRRLLQTAVSYSITQRSSGSFEGFYLSIRTLTYLTSTYLQFGSALQVERSPRSALPSYRVTELSRRNHSHISSFYVL